MWYLSDWANIAVDWESSNMTYRLSVSAALDNSVNATGSWVNSQDMTKVSERYGRIVNNVSLAFPHPGVAAAAQDQHHEILSFEELYVSFLTLSPAGPADHLLRVKASILSMPLSHRQQLRFSVLA